MRILLVDDHLILLDGLKNILESSPEFNVVATCVSGNYALAHLKNDAIDLLITDYSMPDLDGVELVKQAKKTHPNLKIIVLSMHDEPEKVREMVKEDIDGYILKKYAYNEILNAIQIVGRGGKFWSAEISNLLVRGLGEAQPKAEDILTERELDVLKLLIQEKNSREIAEQLFISERTVETHRKNMIRKTNSNSTVGLVKFAYEYNLIT